MLSFYFVTSLARKEIDVELFSSSKLERKNWPIATAPKIENKYKAKTWCRNHQSAGRFYYHYTNTRWWFELEEDAVWFTLQGF